MKQSPFLVVLQNNADHVQFVSLRGFSSFKVVMQKILFNFSLLQFSNITQDIELHVFTPVQSSVEEVGK